MVPIAQLQELVRSVEDDINVTQPLSQDLLSGHKEDEEDLFFEIAIGDKACQSLKHIARKRFLSKWSEREIQTCKEIAL